MKRRRVRIELRLDGALKARYEGGAVAFCECGPEVAAPAGSSKPVRKDHNAGGKSRWMQGFFDRPSPALWQAIGSDAKA